MLTDNRLSICFITSTFAPLIGGAETYALTFSEGMSERGHSVVVVTDGWNRSRYEDERRSDITHAFEVVRLGDYRGLFDQEGVIPWEVLAFGVLPELSRQTATRTIDLVVTNSLDSASLGKVLSIDRDVPWVATFHEQSPELEPLGPARLKMVYGVLRPDLILAGSEFYANRAALCGRGDSTMLITHGVDTRSFRPDLDGRVARRRLGLPDAATVILCAARLTPRKGVDDLIRAFAQLATSWPDAHLLIAGTVNSSNRAYADELRDEVARSGIATRVTFDESCQPADMPSMFAAADIVVQPSRAEGLGLSVIEALSAGRAVITSDIPPTHQIAKGEDVLVMCPPSDVRALAAAIEQLLFDGERRAQLGNAARTHAERWFSRTAMMEKTEQALIEMVQRWRSRESS